MAVQSRQERDDALSVPAEALRALAAAGHLAVAGESSTEALEAFARAAVAACGADAGVVRLLDADGDGLTARAVHATSPALAAQLEGSRSTVSELDGSAAPSLARALHLDHAILCRLEVRGALLGSLEVFRAGIPFVETEQLLAQVAADQLALALRGLAPMSSGRSGAPIDHALVLAGEALAAGADEARTTAQVARLAAEAAAAEASLLWRLVGPDLELAASYGESRAAESAALSAARVALDASAFLVQERIGGMSVASVRLGDPPVGVLQLVFKHDASAFALEGLATFALRAGHALRAGSRARTSALELERTRTLLSVAAQATAQLSLAHTLSIALSETAELLAVERVAVYLRDENGRLNAAADRTLAGPHSLVAETLLGMLLGPFRGRGIVVVDDVTREPAMVSVRGAASEAGIESALGLPLAVRGEVIGLLAVYPELGRGATENEQALLSALASQLAVAVQNALLHEQAKQLGTDLEAALSSERQAARRVRALYEVSRSFAQSLSLEATLDALARNAVELLDVDAAAIRMPDQRRELLTTRALHVADARLDEAARTILMRPQSFSALAIQRLFRTREPLVLDAALARELGGSHELLAPFLEKGSTAAILPIATPAEVVATLTAVSFDPGRPIDDETLDTALSIAAQAALAIDNGRLYQQQKEFADTMQRSLLPRSHPQLRGLEIGEVYESSARVDVGGDVYDYMELTDGRLAVVLGDVTGHGIEATADMAMAKFVFRSLAREHPDPGDFLAAANDVVVGEIAPGKFITMTYFTIDPETGEVCAACAGHPAPLIVSADGGVRPLEAGGLALGVDTGQEYGEDTSLLSPGDAVVVFTDGVVEARRDGELYGHERLAEVLSANRAHSPEAIARTVVDACRAFAGGELADDCAVVVIKRHAA
jgi:serine phosphatase RsbU (regulator of sigma subunit)